MDSRRHRGGGEGGEAQAGRVEMVAAAGVAAMVAAEIKRGGNGGNDKAGK